MAKKMAVAKAQYLVKRRLRLDGDYYAPGEKVELGEDEGGELKARGVLVDLPGSAPAPAPVPAPAPNKA